MIASATAWPGIGVIVVEAVVVAVCIVGAAVCIAVGMTKR